MDLSLIQKDILITLISLYHQHSHPIKGEDIAEVIKRNPGTIRNQMQALKAIGLVDGVPGPKGGYYPTTLAYNELNLHDSDEEYDVLISRNGEIVKGAKVSEIDFTTLCHPDICHALIKLIGSAKIFEIRGEFAPFTISPFLEIQDVIVLVRVVEVEFIICQCPSGNTPPFWTPNTIHTDLSAFKP